MATAHTIRNAHIEEAPVLSELAFRSKAYWGYSEAFMTACHAELTYCAKYIAAQPVFVAESQKKILGFYALEQTKPGQAELEALFVDPNYIGQGIGRALMEHAKQQAWALGVRELLIQGDPHAAKFYQAAGGQLIGKRESDSVKGRYLPLFRIALSSA